MERREGERERERDGERETERDRERQRETEREREQPFHLSHTSVNSEAALRRNGGSPEVKYELDEAGVVSILCRVRIPICQSEGLDEVKRT